MDFRDNILARHIEFSQDGFIELQKSYFVLTEYYNFKIPTFLTKVGEYIDEAREAAEKKDFGEVILEMNEISEFMESFDKNLILKGISPDQIDSFIVETYHVKRAAKNGDSKNIKKGLQVLSESHNIFIKAYE